MFNKKNLLINLFCYAVLITFFIVTPVRAANVTSVEGIIYNLVNQERTDRGLSPLSRYSKLENMARLHSQHMYNQGYMSHTSEVPGYENLSDRAAKAGVTGWSHLGENVGHVSDPSGYYSDAQTLADAIMKAWMESSGHRDNILHDSFTHIGVGGFGGNGEYYFTQNFAAFHNQPPPDNNPPDNNNYTPSGNTNTWGLPSSNNIFPLGSGFPIILSGLGNGLGFMSGLSNYTPVFGRGFSVFGGGLSGNFMNLGGGLSNLGTGIGMGGGFNFMSGLSNYNTLLGGKFPFLGGGLGGNFPVLYHSFVR